MTDIHKLIDEFVKTKAISDGGWPIVDNNDLDAIRNIIDTLLLMKYDLDADGDMVIDYVINDRSKYNLYSVHIPHEGDIASYSRIVSLLNSKSSNVSEKICLIIEQEIVKEKKLEQMYSMVENIVNETSYDNACNMIIEYFDIFDEYQIERIQKHMVNKFGNHLENEMKILSEQIDDIQYDQDMFFTKAIRPRAVRNFKIFGDNTSDGKYYREYSQKRKSLYERSREWRAKNRNEKRP